jgi:hypothetical protein
MELIKGVYFAKNGKLIGGGVLMKGKKMKRGG